MQWSTDQIKELKSYSRRRSLFVLLFWLITGLPQLMVWSRSVVDPKWLLGQIGLSPSFHLTGGAAIWMDGWWGGFFIGAVFVTIFALMSSGVWEPWNPNHDSTKR